MSHGRRRVFLELKAYDEDDFEKDLGTKNYRLLRAMPKGGGRMINVRFNKDMPVTRIAVYAESAGKSVVQPKDKSVVQPKDKWDCATQGQMGLLRN